MRTILVGISVPKPTTSINTSKISPFNNILNNNLKNPGSSFPFRVSPSANEFPLLCNYQSGICRASQVVDLFPTVSPEIVVREAKIEDCWEVAETHCSSFFPGYSFPLDLLLRINRLVGLLTAFSMPRSGYNRTCLVAVFGSSLDENNFFFGGEDFKIGGFDGNFIFNKGYVAGILTIDTFAHFLPRKGPLQQNRTGIAYISNVAVREKCRRKGIAKKLIARAESQARTWGCRSIALHCELNDPVATKLYRGQGFKCVRVPEGANWPQPRTARGVKVNFMMKLLRSSDAS